MCLVRFSEKREASQVAVVVRVRFLESKVEADRAMDRHRILLGASTD